MKNLEIWHNPRCSKSRQALELLEAQAVKPKIVLYLSAPPSREELERVLSLLHVEPHALMRKGEPIYKDLGLDSPHHSRDELVATMIEHPVLIERPIVIADGKAVIGRPVERVAELLAKSG